MQSRTKLGGASPTTANEQHMKNIKANDTLSALGIDEGIALQIYPADGAWGDKETPTNLTFGVWPLPDGRRVTIERNQ